VKYTTTAKPGLVLSAFHVFYMYSIPSGLSKCGKQWLLYDENQTHKENVSITTYKPMEWVTY